MPQTTIGGDYPAFNPGLPLTGKFTAEAWAKLLDIELKTLIANLKTNNIDFLRFGRLSFIDAEQFWIALKNNRLLEKK